VRIHVRTESPDGSSWIEFFPMEFFVWLDPSHDHAPIGAGRMGDIHYPNISLSAAMARYVIAPNRGRMRNLRILGSRPVNDLPKVFGQLFPHGAPKGQGICMRVHYELNGAPVDEEFYGFMPETQSIPGKITEYRKQLILVHSVGARSGKLESVRPLLGFVATSIENNPAWQQRFGEVKKAQIAAYDRGMAKNYAGIRAAGARSQALTAQSNQFLQRVDASLAASRAQQASRPANWSTNDNEEFYKRADDFDQNIRGTEHLQDQYGQVTDQYTDYNYHWTDGFGRYVHTDDPNFDPNKYLTGDYQLMTPPAR
jgi:hypothetical protein